MENINIVWWILIYLVGVLDDGYERDIKPFMDKKPPKWS